MDDWLKMHHDRLLDMGFEVIDDRYTIEIKGHKFTLEWVEQAYRKSAYGDVFYGGYCMRGDVDCGVSSKLFTEAPIQTFQDLSDTVYYIKNVTLDLDFIGDKPTRMVIFIR